MGAMVILLGLAVLFQFIIIRIKWNRGNYADVVVDLVLLFLLNVFFGSTILGVVSATAGSTLISLYLIWFPIKVMDDNTVASLYEEVLGESKPYPFKRHTSGNAEQPDSPEQQPKPGFASRFDKLFT